VHREQSSHCLDALGGLNGQAIAIQPGSRAALRHDVVGCPEAGTRCRGSTRCGIERRACMLIHWCREFTKDLGVCRAPRIAIYEGFSRGLLWYGPAGTIEFWTLSQQMIWLRTSRGSSVVDPRCRWVRLRRVALIESGPPVMESPWTGMPLAAQLAHENRHRSSRNTGTVDEDAHQLKAVGGYPGTQRR